MKFSVAFEFTVSEWGLPVKHNGCQIIHATDAFAAGFKLQTESKYTNFKVVSVIPVAEPTRSPSPLRWFAVSYQADGFTHERRHLWAENRQQIPGIVNTLHPKGDWIIANIEELNNAGGFTPPIKQQYRVRFFYTNMPSLIETMAVEADCRDDAEYQIRKIVDPQCLKKIRVLDVALVVQEPWDSFTYNPKTALGKNHMSTALKGILKDIAHLASGPSDNWTIIRRLTDYALLLLGDDTEKA